MKNKYRDVVSSVFVIALAIFIAYFSKDIRVLKYTSVSANFFPRIIAVMLGGLGIIQLIISILEVKKSGLNSATNNTDVKEDTHTESKIGGIISRNADWVSVILIMAYVFSLGKLGFIISSTVYLFLQMIVLSKAEKRKYMSLGLVAVIAPVVIYLIFTKVFGLMLPAGILG